MTVILPPNATVLCVVNEKVVTAVVTLLVNLSVAPIAMLTDRTMDIPPEATPADATVSASV